TPLPEALSALTPRPHVELLVHAKVARVLEDHPPLQRIPVLGPCASLLGLRREAFDVVVDCGYWAAPSVHHALYARFIARRRPSLGPAAFPVGHLHAVPVRPRGGTRSEVAQRLHLLSPVLGADIGAAPPPMRFRLPRIPTSGDPLAGLLEEIGANTHAVVNP